VPPELTVVGWDATSSFPVARHFLGIALGGKTPDISPTDSPYVTGTFAEVVSSEMPRRFKWSDMTGPKQPGGCDGRKSGSGRTVWPFGDRRRVLPLVSGLGEVWDAIQI
jgi:hypothetical protein